MAETTITELNGRLMARYEAPDRVFEVNCDTVKVTDVTLKMLREGETVGSIYNDHGTEKTMARLSTDGEGDFIGVEVPKAFVRDLLDAAVEGDRVTGDDPEAYALRMLE